MTLLDSARSARPPATGIDFGYATRPVRSRWFSLRFQVRVVMVSAILFTVAVAGALVSVTIGDFPISLRDVFGALTGTAPSFSRTVVLEWRLPLAVAAVVFGAVLGIGGAIFQSLTRNPLGSPDVIGFDAGAYTAVVVSILLLGSAAQWSLAIAAIAGGLVTALVVLWLSYRRGIQGFRMIIVGIGVSYLLYSVNDYLITRADVTDAMTVGFWGAGSLARVTWQTLVPSLVLAGVIVVAAVLLSPLLKRLEQQKELDLWADLWADDAQVLFPISADKAQHEIRGKARLVEITAQKFKDRERIELDIRVEPVAGAPRVVVHMGATLTFATGPVLSFPLLVILTFDDSGRIRVMEEYANEAFFPAGAFE